MSNVIAAERPIPWPTALWRKERRTVEGRQTVMHLLRGVRERVFPVGRLDYHSEGLLLLTNDGELTNRLTHPRYGVPKTYRAVIDGYIQDETIGEIQEGVWLAETIAALLQDPQRLERMGQAARALSHPNAARDIAAMAARVGGIQFATD